MKSIFNIIKGKKMISGAFASAAVLGSSLFTLTSCDDFLTITPTSSIVEEEFWQDKNDLNNAVYACYKRLASEDILTKAIYWGEMRGDNFERSSGISSSSPEANVMNANLLPTYGMFDWTCMYQAINYCNKVLVHGPEVIQNDESFSPTNWTPIHAEMITLRALCHFYLVRSFGEIPYVTKDYNNDSQELRLVQKPQLEVLDSIINDLESVKDDAMVDYGNTVLNKGRITKKAVYALLADVYLWRASYKAGGCKPFVNRTVPATNVLYTPGHAITLEGDATPYGSTATDDYQKCIAYCDQVIQMAKDEKVKFLNENGYNIGGATLNLELEDLLEANPIAGSSSSSSTIIRSAQGAYNTIFGDGNSDESIFEIQFDGVTYGNTMLTSVFYNLKESKSARLTGAVPMFENVDENPNSLLPKSVFTKTDLRRWETLRLESVTQAQTAFNVSKMLFTSVKQMCSPYSYLTDNRAPSTKLSLTYSTRSANNVAANYVMYRLSEIYLMKAEAMSQVYADQENLQKAFSLVREVFKRSNPYAYSPTNTMTAKTDTLNFEVFNTQDGIEKLVMAERQREFICEGRRWFDLVRYAQRRGNTEDMLTILTRKYSSNQKAIKAKLADMQSLFCPVYEQELKSNTWLYQNGVWETTSSSGRTDNL